MKKQVQQHNQFAQWNSTCPTITTTTATTTHSTKFQLTTPYDAATNSGLEYDVSITDGKPPATAQIATIVTKALDGDHPLA